LCKEIFKTTPDDPRIIDMDPIQKMWMYENWIADQNEQAELAKNHAYLLASFSNPEAVKQILGGGGNIHTSTDEEFEDSTRMIKQINDEVERQKQEKVVPRKKRRRVSKG
jgi:hypothetical protein